METLQSISELIIHTDIIKYTKKSKVLAIDLPGFRFIGNYNYNTRINIILDDIYKALQEKGIKIERNNMVFFGMKSQQNIHGNTKLKNLIKKEKPAELLREEPEIKKSNKKEALSNAKKGKKGSRRSTPSTLSKPAIALSRSEIEPLEEEKEMKQAPEGDLFAIVVEKADTGMMVKEKETQEESIIESLEMDEEMEERVKEKVLAPPPPGRGPPRPKAAPSIAPEQKMVKKESISDDVESGSPISVRNEAKPQEGGTITSTRPPRQREYDINMGIQYYNVMMEKKSYLFYVFFSHKKLIIADEEGKSVYTTTIKIVTDKKKPLIMDLKIEGEGFEVHPLSGKVEVKKDAINPPLMIFSVMPLKMGRLKKKSENERRFLDILVEFEGKIVSHSILSIIIQPKFFKLKLGPLSFNLNKGMASAISACSIIITVLLLIYSIWSFDITDITGFDIITGIVPSMGSLLFVIFFIYTLIKGVYPLKQQFQGLLNFNGGGFEK